MSREYHFTGGACSRLSVVLKHRSTDKQTMTKGTTLRYDVQPFFIRWPLAALWLACALLLTACVSPTVTRLPKAGAETSCIWPPPSQDTVVGVSFSGGGSRAALFGAGGLEATPSPPGKVGASASATTYRFARPSNWNWRTSTTARRPSMRGSTPRCSGATRSSGSSRSAMEPRPRVRSEAAQAEGAVDVSL